MMVKKFDLLLFSFTTNAVLQTKHSTNSKLKTGIINKVERKWNKIKTFQNALISVTLISETIDVLFSACALRSSSANAYFVALNGCAVRTSSGPPGPPWALWLCCRWRRPASPGGPQLAADQHLLHPVRVQANISNKCTVQEILYF